MQNANYGPYRWEERGGEHQKHNWRHGHGPHHHHSWGHHGRMGFHHRGGWGHRRGGFPLVPLLFLGFLLLGGWKLIFPLILLAMFGGLFFYMKRHHGGEWRKWAEESRWRWDDDSEKPKRKTDDFVTIKRKNDDDTLYV